MFFAVIFLKSPVSRIEPKNVKEGTSWDILNIHFVAKKEKQRKLQKSLAKPKNMHKKVGQGRDSNPRPSAWQTSKNPN